MRVREFLLKSSSPPTRTVFQEIEAAVPAPLADSLATLIVLWGSFPAVLPLIPKGMPGSHDGEGHLFSLLDFDLAIRSGFPFPRLAPHLALDYAYASFTFYAPGSLYLTEAFRFFGLGYIASFKAFFALCLLLSAFGMYLLARNIYGRRGATIAALAYVYLPYHLLDVYTRADVGEVLGLAVVPFVGWSLRRVARRSGRDTIAVAALFGAVLVVSHNLTALIAAPIVALLTLAPLPRRRSTWLALGISGALAALLSAAYWLPVLTQLGTIDTSALTNSFFDYHQRFIPAAHLVQWTWAYNYDYNPETDALFNLGRVQAVVLAIAGVWALVARPRGYRLLLLSGAVILALVWGEQAGSVAAWDLFPPARYIQFPYRLSVDVTVLSAILLGAAAATRGEPVQIANRARETVRRVGLWIAVVSLAALVGASWVSLPRTRTDLTESRVNLQMLWRLEADRQLIATSTQTDYVPREVQAPFFTTAARRPSPPGPLNGSPISATLLDSSLFGLRARVESAGPATLTFDWFAYPAWNATMDGRPVPIHAVPPLDLIGVDVPDGVHVLSLQASGTPYDHLGLVLTGATLLFLLLLASSILAQRAERRIGLLFGLSAVVLVGSSAVAIARQVQPSVPLRGGIDFRQGNERVVRLVGARWNPSVRTPDRAVDLTLFWEALATPLSDCTVQVRLIDSQGAVAGSRDKAPLLGLRDCATWRPGEIVRDEQEVRLRPGESSGTYRVAVGMTLSTHALVPNTSTSVALWAEPSAAEDSGVILGTLPVPAPVAVASPAALAVPGSVPVRVTLGDSLELESASVSSRAPATADERFVARTAPNDILHLRLVWRALSDVSTDYSVFAHLIGPDGHLAAQDDAWADRFGFPTSVWFPGDARVDRYDLAPSAPLAPGVYHLTTGMYTRPGLERLPVSNAPGGTNEIDLGRVKVTASDHVFGSPRPLTPRDDVFADQIALVGAAVTPPTRPGNPLLVDVSWRALTRPRDDDTVFVHVIDASGNLEAQHDAQPLDGRYPTSLWDPGDTIDDQVAIALPPRLPAGRYRVEVGLYHAKDLTRLSLADHATSIWLPEFIWPGH